MSKLTKYLESKTKDFEYNLSGSSYFVFGNRKIRVSNHLPVLQVDGDLYILTSGNSNIIYVVSVYGKVFTFVRFGEIKSFVDHWLMIDNHKSIVKTETTDARILELKQKLEKMNSRVTKAESAKPVIIGGIGAGKNIFPMNKFSVQQQNAIMNFIKQIK